MFISNNTMILTEQGCTNVGKVSDGTVYTTDGYFNFDMLETYKKTKFIKTDIFPTITIGKETELLIGRVYSKDGSIFMKNQFFQAEQIKSGDYIVVPKTHFKSTEGINRTIAWLYAKYIVSGYFCSEKQTNRDMIVINVRKMSKKEALRLRRYADITYDLEKMLIVIKNQDIINMFRKDKKHLIKNVYSLESHIAEYFLHSMRIEFKSNFLEIKNKTMAYDLFLFFYSKLNKIFTIIEEKNEKNKTLYMKEVDAKEYIIVNNLLYVKINNLLEGKEVAGVEIPNVEEKKVHGVFMLFR